MRINNRVETQHSLTELDCNSKSIVASFIIKHLHEHNARIYANSCISSTPKVPLLLADSIRLFFRNDCAVPSIRAVLFACFPSELKQHT
jgi:hypothetical protein